MSSGKLPTFSDSTALKLLYRYTDLSRQAAQRKIDERGASDAVRWAHNNFSVLSKAMRDDNFEVEDDD
jgi:hypothetical protein